ncbi:MAG: hypothetical protein IMF06_02285, partial [Proteobacteria bacterium]|nr:hypothetical protein [Pseudomonadota bacterium]
MNSRFAYLYLLAASSLLSMPLSASAAPGVVEELKTCARIVERDARINCYESLGKRVLGEEPGAPAASAPPQTAPAATAAAAPVSAVATSTEAPASKAEMDEYMGGYKFEEKPSDHPDNTIYARVILCQQDRDKAWFFKFENGQ